MNENYLKYLFSTISPYGRFNDPFEISYEMDSEDFIERIKTILKEEDITFLKEGGLKRHQFIPKKRIFSINLENLNDLDMEYFKRSLMQTWTVPTRYFVDTDPIDYFDEYH